MIEANGFFVGGGSLNRDMALNMRIAFCGILKHGEVSENQRVRAKLSRHIYGALPASVAIGMGKSIDGDM
ncbi:hypothetical protein D3C86_2075920 [compost metagenome]